MISESKSRVSMTISKDMMARVDYYRQPMGLTRSMFCSYLIGQGLLGLERAQGIMDGVAAEAARQAAAMLKEEAASSDQQE